MRDASPTTFEAPSSPKDLRYRGSFPDERREEAREWGMETAANILIRGKVAEALDNITSACYQYEAARRVAEFFSQSSEAGEAHYNIGRCMSRLGDPCRSFSAYVAAARMFRVDEAPNKSPHRLSDALGEAGMLLVVSGSYICDDRPADEDLLEHGLDDSILHASTVLFGEDPPTRADLTTLHRKLTGLLVLAASVSVCSVLLRARHVIETEIIEPFSRRYGAAPTSFVALTRLFAALGEQEKLERVGVPATKLEIRNLVVEVYSSFEGQERAIIMRWLGYYLRVNRRAKWEIEDSIDDEICAD